ncbi:MAG TPA: recombination regulator RecX [Candidatus Dietzia intestinipullorum]|nr:recombination regulator RecX [Candidatus Dietzia intestinipullorum]
MRGPERPSPSAPEELRTAVSAVENRGPAAADLPPLQAAAYDAAKAGLRLLKHRARSEHELRQRLLTAEHAADAVDEAVERIRAWGLLDDADFAAEWVRGRRRRRGRSRGALERELREKGVAESHIADAVADIDEADERERAGELIRGRLARTGEGTTNDRSGERRRLVAFLARRGYPTGLAVSVVDSELAARAVP